MIEAAELARLDLFVDVQPHVLARLSGELVELPIAAGDVLMKQGELDHHFLVVLDGSVEVVRGQGDTQRRLAVCGPGSILGELSLLRETPRVASVGALTAGRVAVGDRRAFAELLELPGVHERIADVTARRLAEIARPLRTELGDGTAVLIRPLLRADRSRFAEEVRRLLPESRRKRFFTAGTPSDRMIDYLVNIDYIDHFAWTVSTPEHVGLATARYVRETHHPESAEVAFGVADHFHGRGLGTLLLGALGAAAEQAGITTFVAEVLEDNYPMRAVFDKAGAAWHRADAGVVDARMAVSATRALITVEQWQGLGDSSAEIVTAAGAALAHLDHDAGS